MASSPPASAGLVDILPALKDRDSLGHPRVSCFTAGRPRGRTASRGLTPAPQAFCLSASPAARSDTDDDNRRNTRVTRTTFPPGPKRPGLHAENPMNLLPWTTAAT